MNAGTKVLTSTETREADVWLEEYGTKREPSTGPRWTVTTPEQFAEHDEEAARREETDGPGALKRRLRQRARLAGASSTWTEIHPEIQQRAVIHERATIRHREAIHERIAVLARPPQTPRSVETVSTPHGAAAVRRRPPLYPPGKDLPADVAAQFRAERGPDARAALDQIVALQHLPDDPVGVLIDSVYLHEHCDLDVAAWAAVDADGDGRPVAIRLDAHPHLLAFSAPCWGAADPEIVAAVHGVIRSGDLAHTLVVFRCSRNLNPTRLDEVARGLIHRLAPAEAVRVYALPIAGTGAADETRWSFTRHGVELAPASLARLAGVGSPIMAIEPAFTTPPLPRRQF